QAQRLAGRRDQTPLLALHRHTRVVRHLLVAVGEPVEQGGLAAVGVAHQGHERATAVHMNDAFLHACASGRRGCTWMQSASARRKAKVESPTRTTSGSPPGTARAMI